MSSDLERFTRRKIASLLDKYRCADDGLEAELIEACWAVRAFQPSGPAQQIDQRIAMIERVWGCKVPAELHAALISDLGDATEDQLRSARVDWLKKNPRNRDAFTAVSWAKHAGRDNRRPAARPGGTKTDSIMDALNIMGIGGNGD